jgi:ATP-dependent helicase Lhr and Lhr-like helicase
MALEHFHSVIRKWFSETLGEPTRAQQLGWAAIRERRHTLIAAPTGSGKTLAAFLNALDDLFHEGLRAPLPDEVRVVYVSPLKALSADIHKNLAEPRAAIRRLAEEMGLEAPRITAAVRTGDTTSSERASMLKTPPHILVTTPESLYLLLTAERSRAMLRTVRTVIVDEIHAVIGTRRGAHLALTLERLQQVACSAAALGAPPAGAPAPHLLRLGLSATQKPIEEVARYLVGGQAPSPVRFEAWTGEGACPPDVIVVDEGHRREMDLTLEIPRSPLDAVMSHEVWEEYYSRITELILEHRTTLVFVNTRRMAERVARHLSDRLGDDAVTAHHGSLSKENRLDAESRLKNGQLKALVATASLELGIDIGHVDLVCQIGSPHRIATLLQRVGRSGHTVSGLPKGRVFPVSRDDLVECAALLRAVKRGELDRILTHDAPLDVLAQQIVAESSCDEYGEDELFEMVRRAWPYRALERKDFDAVVSMVSDGFATRRGRRAALVHRDEVNAKLRGRRGARMLSITSGGAIPEVADYRVVLEGEETFIGTLNEDFAIESTAGDIFQLGNASWQIVQVGSGIVRVSDAKGAPPTIPFWLGEAPARSDELSRAVSDLRREFAHVAPPPPAALAGDGAGATWLVKEAGISEAAANEIANYLEQSHTALGVMPTQETLVLERFFDESGGMQLVLHAPFGSRINKAWGLALRKRFCRQFNFELQAAATEDAVLLSLGPQHSFPLADVFRYLHPATSKDILVQAFLAAPMFQTRWRWNTTISLAIPRNRNGRKIPPPLQRAMADDLMAAVFPDAAACPENLPGDRELPDHPLVNQVVRDCLEEAMDFEGLARVLTRIHAGEIECVARDTTEPSPLCHEILNAKPYAFLDDAPLEERRTQAVYTRRTTADDLGTLDQNAIERVRDEERPDPRDADELHDALLTFGFLTDDEVSAQWAVRNAQETGAQWAVRSGRGGEPSGQWSVGSAPEANVCAPRTAHCALMKDLVASRRAGRVGSLWVAAERLPEMLAVNPVRVDFAPPPSRAAREWTREEAIVELLRGRLSFIGPTTARALAASLNISENDADLALLKLENEGVVLRGTFEHRGAAEWCDRRLLARIHRYTLNRLRAEIEPVTANDFMRFLFSWQHVPAKLMGLDGLRAVIAQLDGYEISATAWERHVLPQRIDRYEPSMLDMLCLTGEVSWARLTTSVALFPRANGKSWLGEIPMPELSEAAKRAFELLQTRGASFTQDLGDRDALNELVNAGLITSDGFAGRNEAGRWSIIPRGPIDIEAQARSLLRRYGVVFRRLVAREPNTAPWRELARVYRRLEARGEIRGGRFVTGMSGEQFALGEAVDRLREVRREGGDGRLVVISAADPLNLTGIITSGERVRAIPSNRIAYRDGVAVSTMEGDCLRPLAAVEPAQAMEVAAALAGRRVPVASGFVGRSA